MPQDYLKPNEGSTGDESPQAYGTKKTQKQKEGVSEQTRAHTEAIPLLPWRSAMVNIDESSRPKV
jgi:hypothetical protein